MQTVVDNHRLMKRILMKYSTNIGIDTRSKKNAFLIHGPPIFPPQIRIESFMTVVPFIYFDDAWPHDVSVKEHGRELVLGLSKARYRDV